MGSASSSPKQIQIEFTPWILASEPISKSNGFSAFLMLPEEILLKIWGFAGVEAMRNLIATCKYIRNRLDTWFLRALASENNPDRATSGFIVDAIGDKSNACLWRNAKFFIKDHDIPKELSIHLFANTTAEKISSDEVSSMIIQVSGLPSSYDPFNPSDPHHDIRRFIAFLFLKVSFENLKCLMFCGIELSNYFSQEIGALKLNVFHMRNFRHDTDLTERNFFCYWNSLKTLCVVHPNECERVFPPKELKKLAIYCPRSSKDMIERRRDIYAGLDVNVYKCHALKGM